MLAAVYNPSVKRGSDENLINIKSGLPIADWTGVTVLIQLRDKGASETAPVRSQFEIGAGVTVSVVEGTGSLVATFSSDPADPNTSVLEPGEYDYDLMIRDSSGARLYYLEGVCTIRKRSSVPS